MAARGLGQNTKMLLSQLHVPEPWNIVITNQEVNCAKFSHFDRCKQCLQTASASGPHWGTSVPHAPCYAIAPQWKFLAPAATKGHAHSPCIPCRSVSGQFLCTECTPRTRVASKYIHLQNSSNYSVKRRTKHTVHHNVIQHDFPANFIAIAHTISTNRADIQTSAAVFTTLFCAAQSSITFNSRKSDKLVITLLIAVKWTKLILVTLNSGGRSTYVCKKSK